MFGLRPPEMIFIALIILFFFGAKKLPEMGKGIGEGIKNFKRSMKFGDSKDDKDKDDKDNDDKKSA
jgi:sec-independent protein translocase protein TatA